jgi:thiaminase/transcriptional activator TenA
VHLLLQEFLAYFSTTVERETAAACLAPYPQLYTSYILATVHEKAFYEGIAAILPCFVLYQEIGKALLQQGEGNFWGNLYAFLATSEASVFVNMAWHHLPLGFLFNCRLAAPAVSEVYRPVWRGRV